MSKQHSSVADVGLGLFYHCSHGCNCYCRVLFWFAILMAAVVLIHMAVLAAFLFSRWSTPDLLHFPRPELLVLFIALAAIAQGAASQYSML